MKPRTNRLHIDALASSLGIVLLLSGQAAEAAEVAEASHRTTMILESALDMRASGALPIPWKTNALQYAADHKDLKEILRELAASQGVMTKISPQIEGNVTGKFSDTPQRFLEQLSASFGFSWYYDGTVLHLSGANEAKSVVIGLNYASSDEIRTALKRMHIADKRFPLVADAAAGTVLVSGPPRYVDLVTDIAGKIDHNRSDNRQPVVRVFPLHYAWAADHPIRVDGQVMTITGVANILRAAYQSNQNMPREQPVSQTEVRHVGSVLPKSAPQGQGANFWGSTLPGLGAAAGGDSQPLNPPLPKNLAAGDNVPASPPMSGGVGWEERPSIEADPRSNSLLIRDYPEKMAAYASLIASLDTRPQVLEISASIIDVTENGLAQLGVDWRLHGSHIDFETGNGDLAQAGMPGSVNPVGFGNPNSSSIPVAATPLGGTFTAVAGSAANYLLTRVSALQQTSDARITASPKVATLDNVEAVMTNKSTFYVPVAGFQSADLFSVSAGTSLRVLPMVVSENDRSQIRLNVHIEDGQLTSQVVGQLPVVSNSEIDTQAMIREGESLLIAGYSVEQDSKQNRGVPWLSSLPMVGNLFKYKQDQKQKFQRLFLLTPRIINLN